MNGVKKSECRDDGLGKRVEGRAEKRLDLYLGMRADKRECEWVGREWQASQGGSIHPCPVYKILARTDILSTTPQDYACKWFPLDTISFASTCWKEDKRTGWKVLWVCWVKIESESEREKEKDIWMHAVVINAMSACLCFKKCARVFLWKMRAVGCMKYACVNVWMEEGRSLKAVVQGLPVDLVWPRPNWI